MSIDHKKIYAAAGASLCVRFSVGSLAVCCGLLGSLAHADDGDRGDHGGRHDAPVREVSRDMQREMMMQRGQPPAPRSAEQPQGQAMQQRQIDPRSYEGRAEEQRRAMQESSHNAEMNRRAGRLTPDERRDLRRQINEVGQDLYANPPRH